MGGFYVLLRPGTRSLVAVPAFVLLINSIIAGRAMILPCRW
jgi:hypothetical protein